MHPLEHIVPLAFSYAHYTYLVLFVVMFLEATFLWMSWLPMQALLFISGSVAAQQGHGINIFILLLGYIVLSQAGTSFKYWSGHRLKPVKSNRLDEAVSYLRNHETTSLIFSHFIPVVGLLLPILAGREKLPWQRFFKISLIGNVVWIVSISLLGYFFGQLKFVHQYYSLVILVVSLLPLAIYLGWRALADLHKAYRD